MRKGNTPQGILKERGLVQHDKIYLNLHFVFYLQGTGTPGTVSLHRSHREKFFLWFMGAGFTLIGVFLVNVCHPGTPLYYVLFFNSVPGTYPE